jgi:hypothetical protein
VPETATWEGYSLKRKMMRIGRMESLERKMERDGKEKAEHGNSGHHHTRWESVGQ